MEVHGLKSARVIEDISSPSPPPSISPIIRAPAPKFNFFDLIIEIRLKIYKELLAVPEPYSFSIGTGRAYYSEHFNIDPHAKEGIGSSLSLLRVNKQIYLEAIPILYRNNTFELTRALECTTQGPNNSTFQFLTQIGNRNASLIRHLGIYFPWLSIPLGREIQFERKLLELIAAKCTGLATIKMLIWDNPRMWEHQTLLQPQLLHEYTEIGSISAELLKLIDTELKKISSLPEIIVDYRIWKELPRPKSNEKLIQMMLDCGWKVQVTREEWLEDSDSEMCCRFDFD